MLYTLHRFRYNLPSSCRWRASPLNTLIRYSSSSNKQGGPPKEKVMGIPFAQHVKAAEKVNAIK